MYPSPINRIYGEEFYEWTLILNITKIIPKRVLYYNDFIWVMTIKVTKKLHSYVVYMDVKDVTDLPITNQKLKI